jgi:hypothetical protein
LREITKTSVDYHSTRIKVVKDLKTEMTANSLILYTREGDDSSAMHYTGLVLPQKGCETKVNQQCLKSPEKVYRLSPNYRLRYMSGPFCGLQGQNGYGVHIAAMKNYNYCVAVAKWLQKKYHFSFMVLEDETSFTHFHLVFGRWCNYKSAEIFKGKVRRDAPNAFVFRWMMDNKLLTDNSIIIFVD